MAIYRFRISFEDYDEIVREIDMLPKHTFLDLHLAIQKNLGYEAEVSSSFYISNDQWKKGKEIAYLPSENKINQKVSLMEDSRLNQFIDDPHQKFYYTYNFSRPYDFHVQLIKILKEEEGKTYPSVFKSIGTSPKPFNQTTIIEAVLDEDEEKEFDFLNEMEFESDDAEDLDILDDEDSVEGEDEFSESDSNDDNY
jgi:hypothetical protein